jgi:zinc protease
MSGLLPSERRIAVRRGVVLRVVDLPQARALHLALLFREGAAGDPRGLGGLTHLAARMPFEGTRRRGAQDLAAALEGLGIRTAVEARHEAAILRFSLPRALFLRATPLLEEMLFEPGLRETDFDRLRAQTAAGLEKEDRDAGVVATNDLNALLMRGTPQAHPPKGTPASVRAASLRDAAARLDGLAAGGVTAVACGRVGRREEEALLRLLRRFPPAGPPPEPLRRLTPAPPGIYFRPWPGAVQSELRLGTRGPVPGAEAWFPSILLNTLLGGKFSSRLMLNLRETHGFTYGVRSFFQERRALSCFCVSAAVASGVTVPALRELFHELDGMAAPDFDPKEVADAAGYLAGSFRYALDNPSLYLGRVVEREVLGLPEAHFRRYLAFLRRSPRFDLSAVPRAPFDRSRGVVVVVGSPSVRRSLRSLRLPLREI